MSKIAAITFETDALMVSGDLDVNNVMSIYQQAVQKFSQYKTVIIDFSAVTSSDSAGLALIVEWIKYAKRQEQQIQFMHLSQDILSLADASGLDQLINK